MNTTRLAGLALFAVTALLTIVGTGVVLVAIVHQLHWAATGATWLHDPNTFGFIGLVVAMFSALGAGITYAELLSADTGTVKSTRHNDRV